MTKALKSNLLPSSSHQLEPRTLHQTTAITQYRTTKGHSCIIPYTQNLSQSISDPLQNPIYLHVHDAINAIIFVEPTTPMDVGVRIGLGVGVGVSALLIIIAVAVAVPVLVRYGKKKG